MMLIYISRGNNYKDKQNNRGYIKSKTRETRVNVSEHATVTAAQSAVTSRCEHIYDRSTILKNRT